MAPYLPFFTFSVHAEEGHHTSAFASRFEHYRGDVTEMTPSEVAQLRTLLEAWVNAMVKNTVMFESDADAYEEYEATFRMPRYVVRAGLCVHRGPPQPLASFVAKCAIGE